MQYIEPTIKDREVISTSLNPEKVVDNSLFQIEEERQINEKARRRYCVLQFSGLLNADYIDRRNYG